MLFLVPLTLPVVDYLGCLSLHLDSKELTKISVNKAYGVPAYRVSALACVGGLK